MNQQLTEFCPMTSSASAQNCGIFAFFRQCSPQDYLVFAYLLYLNVALLPRIGHTDYVASAVRMFLLLAAYLALIIPIRARLWQDGFWAPVGYRVALQGTVQASYFLFAAYLPLVNPTSLDNQLFALDLRLFGFEPSIVFDSFITKFTSEWFAFFYFSYFFILASHTLPILFCARDERLLGEFSFGMLLLFCVGQAVYTVVPGFGPYRAIPHLFTHAFPSGLWVDTVMNTVATSGAQKDIFPSLHTAAPTFIALFSARFRHTRPFKWTWPVMTFFAANIIIATMFLRWHWLIDVVAGLILAFSAFGLSIVVTRLDLARRERHQLGPSWPRFACAKTACAKSG